MQWHVTRNLGCDCALADPVVTRQPEMGLKPVERTSTDLDRSLTMMCGFAIHQFLRFDRAMRHLERMTIDPLNTA
ncbi:MAG: hypothetical protein WCH39_18745 [Schlesneria sp.]